MFTAIFVLVATVVGGIVIATLEDRRAARHQAECDRIRRGY